VLLAAAVALPAAAQETFNTLEAVSVDPSGRVELFGKMAPEGPPTPIAYRQILAEALANPESPQFSLDSDFSRFTGDALAGKSMEDLFYSEPGVLSPFGLATLEALRVPAPAAGGSQDLTAIILRQAGYSLAADLQDALPPGESVPSPATRARWVQLLRLGPELRSYLDAREQGLGANAEAADRFYIRFIQGLESSMVPDAPALLLLYREARDAGTAPDQALQRALERFLAAYTELTAKSVAILMERHQLGAVVVKAEGLRKSFGAAPVSRPRFVNLEPGSQLARVLLEGDFALKSLPLDASLSEISGYQTFPQWAASQIDPAALGTIQTSRLWVALEGAQVEIRESVDGNIASFGKVQLQVESRTKSADDSWDSEVQDPRTQSYADMLSKHFDEIAERIPALHQLREAAKLVALAKWIRQRGVEADLAHEPLAWEPPEEVDGFLAMVPSATEGRLYWGVLPSGGVDFQFDIVVTKDPSLTLENLRKGAGTPGRSSLETLREQSLRQQLDRLQAEVDRTASLEEHLRSSPTDAGALAAHLERTGELRDAERQEMAGRLEAAAAALGGLGRQVPALPDEVRRPFVAALAAAPPHPRLEELPAWSEDARQQAGALRAGAGPGIPDDLLAPSGPVSDVVSAVESWLGALDRVSREASGVFEQASSSVTSLNLFVVEALGALVALSLYREHTVALQMLTPAGEATGTALPAVRGLHRRQAARLAEMRRRLSLSAS
jgi:hypothetical protein